MMLVYPCVIAVFKPSHSDLLKTTWSMHDYVCNMSKIKGTVLSGLSSVLSVLSHVWSCWSYTCLVLVLSVVILCWP